MGLWLWFRVYRSAVGREYCCGFHGISSNNHPRNTGTTREPHEESLLWVSLRCPTQIWCRMPAWQSGRTVRVVKDAMSTYPHQPYCIVCVLRVHNVRVLELCSMQMRSTAPPRRSLQYPTTNTPVLDVRLAVLLVHTRVGPRVRSGQALVWSRMYCFHTFSYCSAVTGLPRRLFRRCKPRKY